MQTWLHFYTGTRLGSVPLNMVVYSTLMAGCWVYALWRGGAPERLGATILAVASLLTGAAISGPASFRSVEIGALLVDLLCLVAFLVLALRAERYWPLWVAALQIVGTAVHAVRFVDPDIIHRTYAFMVSIWAYPMIALMVVGTWRHQQRLARLGSDKSWSSWRR